MQSKIKTLTVDIFILLIIRKKIFFFLIVEKSSTNSTKTQIRTKNATHLQPSPTTQITLRNKGKKLRCDHNGPLLPFTLLPFILHRFALFSIKNIGYRCNHHIFTLS